MSVSIKQPASHTPRLLAKGVLSLCYILGGLLVGTVLGGLGGLCLGMLLARGYTKQGPSDVADGPVYVGIGLIFFGAGLGAILGLIAGVFLMVLTWAGRLDDYSHQQRNHLPG